MIKHDIEEIHEGLNIRDLLKQAIPAGLRERLTAELEAGHEVIPAAGHVCDRWSWFTGCRGHQH